MSLFRALALKRYRKWICLKWAKVLWINGLIRSWNTLVLYKNNDEKKCCIYHHDMFNIDFHVKLQLFLKINTSTNIHSVTQLAYIIFISGRRIKEFYNHIMHFKKKSVFFFFYICPWNNSGSCLSQSQLLKKKKEYLLVYWHSTRRTGCTSAKTLQEELSIPSDI